MAHFEIPPESRHVATGAETVFGFGFEYLTPDDIEVTVDGVPQLVTLVSLSQVLLTPAPVEGALVVISRNTAAQYARYEFGTGVPFLPRYVDENNRQLLYSVQEALFSTADTAAGALVVAEEARDTAEEALALIEAAVIDSAAALRVELASPVGAGLLGTANGQTVEQRLAPKADDILKYGTPGGVDDTAIAQAMIDATNSLIVPYGMTLAVKNLQLRDDTFVYSVGVLKLRAGCDDFDKILNATNKRGINLYARELDGNASGQTGPVGTHLLYATNPMDCVFNVDYAHDHYYPTGAVIVNTDGIRDTSSGAVFLYRPVRGSMSIRYLYSWGREGVQVREGVRHLLHNTRCQGVDGGPEYSGIQVSGTLNQGHTLNVDNAGASGIGWDTTYGVGSNWTSTNSRENHGVNFGHPGYPATGSVITGLMVDGAVRYGVSIAASTLDLVVNGYVVRNAGELGVSVSDGSLRPRFSNGLVEFCGTGNLSAFATTLTARNSVNTTVDAGGVLLVTSAVGTFAVGETVTAGGISGVVRATLRHRASATQTLFLASKTGTFVPGAITGGTSGAVGTITAVRVPLLKREVSGGVVIQDEPVSIGGLGEVSKFPDGTMIHRHTISVVAAANTLTSVPLSYPSGAPWVAIPKVMANVATASSTNAFNLSRLTCERSLSGYTVHLTATVAQTYGVDIVSIGRWYT